MNCPKCSKDDVRLFERIEQHRLIVKEEDGKIFVGESRKQDDDLVESFLECAHCGWTVLEHEIETLLGVTIEYPE